MPAPQSQLTYAGKREYRAVFETWVLAGRSLPGQFTILLRLEQGRAFRWKAYLLPTMEPMQLRWQGKLLDSLPEGQLEEAQKAVAQNFKTQVSEWA